MSQRCATCIHWDKDGPETDGHPTQRRCNYEREAEDRAACVNGEPYNAGVLATGPLFGCIHHQATPAAPG
jgi:hypothetical protein